MNGIKLLSRIRLHFRRLNDHKCWHNFRATIDPMCSCGLEPETMLHYLLRWNLYSDLWTELLNDICALNPILEKLFHEKLLNIFLYSSEDVSFNTNKKIVTSTIKFLKTSERFIGPLLFFYIAVNIEWKNPFLKIIFTYVRSISMQMHYDQYQYNSIV